MDQSARANAGIPRITGFLCELTDPSLAGAHSLDVRGDLAAVVGKAGNVSLVDVGDPANMLLLGSHTEGLKDTEAVLFLDEKHLFVGDHGRALVIDVSDPGAPKVLPGSDLNCVNSTLNDGPLNDAVRCGDYVFCPNKGVHVVVRGDNPAVERGGGYVEVFDVSDPAHMRHAGSFRDPDRGSTHGLAVLPERGLLVYVNQMRYYNGRRLEFVNPDQRHLAVLDIGGSAGGSPREPVLLGQLAHPDMIGSNQVCAEGDYAYAVSIDTDMLSVIDIRDPREPRLVASVDSLSVPVGVCKQGDAIFVGNNNPADRPKPLFLEKSRRGLAGKASVVDVRDPQNPRIDNEFLHESLTGGHQLARSGDALLVTAGGGSDSYFPSLMALSVED